MRPSECRQCYDLRGEYANNKYEERTEKSIFQLHLILAYKPSKIVVWISSKHHEPLDSLRDSLRISEARTETQRPRGYQGVAPGQTQQEPPLPPRARTGWKQGPAVPYNRGRVRCHASPSTTALMVAMF